MNLKKIGKVLTSKFVGTGPSFYKKRIYRAAVSQRLRNTALEDRTDIFSPRTSVSNYKPTPRNVTEVHRTRNLKFLCLYFQVVTVVYGG